MMAQGHLTAGTKLAMQPSHVQAISATSGQRASLRAFITVSDPAAVQRLRQLGVRVHMCFGHMVTATVPLSLVGSVCRMAGVRQLAVAQLSQLCNDSAMADAHVVPVAVGTGFNIPYTGRDVVVGVIDTGVDFNHINLCDSMGRSRVVAAYLPQDSTGTSPVIHGDTLPGSHYNTPEQIALLTTDDPTASHGTHTIGTASGSCFNGFQGVAPGARLVVCAMPLLYDTDIANSLAYIFNYADSVGLPAVVNMSFASIDGPHDGTSPLCQVFDQISGPGRILSVSAHNSGYAAL
ncbi:MAG: S8 family serine peptidase, partial [Muribaculaceae bacterium]|nr:S8 family serine peptidase [Muribaculaceae bacterium]